MKRQHASSEAAIPSITWLSVALNPPLFLTGRFAPYILLAIWLTLVHGLLLLNTGVYWDGWIIYGASLNRSAKSVIELFYEAGNPIVGHFHAILQQLPLPLIFSYKFVGFISIIVSGLLTYRILTQFCRFTSLEAGFVVLASSTYPAFKVGVEISIIPYLLCYALFVVGAVLVLAAEAGSSIRRKLNYLAALVCFALSFNLPSLISLYLAFFPILWINSPRYGSTARRVYSFFRKFELFLLLPLVFIWVRSLAWQPSGQYVDYNRINLNFQQVYRSAGIFVRNSVLEPFLGIGTTIKLLPLIVSLSLVALLIAALFIGRAPVLPYSGTVRQSSERDLTWRNVLGLGFYAFLVFALAILPYALVGKPATVSGWDSRHAFLIGLPVGLALLAVARAFHHIFGKKILWLSASVGLVLIAAFSVRTAEIYLDWQFRWIKDQSFIHALRARPSIINQNVSYAFVHDKYLVNNQQYLYYEYNGMFKLAFGRERLIGNPQVETTNLRLLAEKLPWPRYLLSDFRPEGCSVVLTPHFQPSSGRVSTVFLYYWQSLFAPDNLAASLEDMTQLDLLDLSQQRVRDLEALVAAVRRYHQDHGFYPRFAATTSGWEAYPAEELRRLLVPYYMAEIPVDLRRDTASNVGYLYFSNGTDFKVIAHNPEDIECVLGNRPALRDPRRKTWAYGFWSAGSAQW